MTTEISSISGTNLASKPGNGQALPTTSAATAKANQAEPASAGAVTAAERLASGQDPALAREQLERIASELEQFVSGNQRALSFHVDDDTGRDVVVVKDIQRDEVIRQVPAEEVLELAARLSDLSGLLIETQA
ncbi:flagellar protein FlaG [Ferrimonas pelagia]|uniref:Flagellar protein FlaG n=1 Tax=Ferrimonas pelagia TaxID=1177826 RepID=A0ABP9ED80_9GAMM